MVQDAFVNLDGDSWTVTYIAPRRDSPAATHEWPSVLVNCFAQKPDA
jgi:hypothetical protein